MARDDTAGRGFGAAAKTPLAKQNKKKAKVAQSIAVEPAGANDDAALLAAEARGRQYLEEMRKEAGEAEGATARKWTAGLTEEELRPKDPTEGVMPEAVSNRMLQRILPFAGLPILGAFGLFGGFWYANTQLALDLPPQIVAYSTQALFFLSFAGISWGVMSTSWEEDDEGSLLGVDQVKANTQAMRDGLARDRNQASAMYEENDAAAAGVIMSKRALRKVEAARRAEERDA